MEKVRRYTADHLKLVDKFHDLVSEGKKTSTIRLGFVFINNESLTLTFVQKPELTIKILKIDYSKCLKDITDSDAVKDGFENSESLKNELLKFYPNITDDSQVTIFYFRVWEKNRL